MTIPLQDYDFAGARKRLLARVDVTRRVVRDRRGELDFERTRQLRENAGVDDALGWIEILLVAALCDLPIAEGGLVAAGGKALATAMSVDQPLVQALLILGSHPNHPGYTHRPLAASGRSVPNVWENTAHDAGPFLTAQTPLPWSVAALEEVVQRGVLAVYGSARVNPELLTFEQAPGSKLGSYLRILAASALLDAIGAWEPTFTRRDALAGEWWLLQPVSPRLDHHEVASKVGLELVGFLPDDHVDVKGRALMACYPRNDMPDDVRAERIADTKWIAGWQRVVWTAGVGPLADEAFELLEYLEGITESSYGTYVHSSELPPYPQAPSPYGPDGGARARAFAQAVLAELGAPEDPNAAALDAQNDRRKSKIAEASYLRTGQVKPKPPCAFAGPARTLAELRFAASLEHCPRCDDRVDPTTMTTHDRGGGAWEVSGVCMGCGEPRRHEYRADLDVESAAHAPHELGVGPSRMIPAALLHGALREAMPMIAPEPERLDADEREISTRANLRVVTCLHELAKLDDPSVDKAWVAAETERQMILRKLHGLT